MDKWPTSSGIVNRKGPVSEAVEELIEELENEIVRDVVEQVAEERKNDEDEGTT